MYHILHIIGARPHFMKLAPVYQGLKSNDQISQKIIHTGQHYDFELSGQFIAEFELPKPDVNLEIGSKGHLGQIADILLGLDRYFEEHPTDMVVVYGDTNTTAAGAIAAAKVNIPIAHIEAGLREWDKSIPEEVNKLLTDAVTDLYFAPSDTGAQNLKRNGILEGVHETGDVVISYIHNNNHRICEELSILAELNITKENYFLATCHRAANTDDPVHLKEILTALQSLPKKVIFLLHPRTRQAIKSHGLEAYVDNENILTTHPLSFWRTQCLIQNAKMILTDSGGMIKEAYYHRKQSIILDKQTEWVEVLEHGWSYIAGPSKENILYGVHNQMNPPDHPELYFQPDAPEMISRIIFDYLEGNEKEIS